MSHKLSKEPTETELILRGFGVSLAKFYYRLPDFVHVINEFTWRDYDQAPDYPNLFKFIEFWQTKIEGRLHSVVFSHNKLIRPGQWQNVVSDKELKFDESKW